MLRRRLTTNSSDTAGRTLTGVPSARTHRTMSRKGGRLVPASTDSEDSVTCRAGVHFVWIRPTCNLNLEVVRPAAGKATQLMVAPHVSRAGGLWSQVTIRSSRDEEGGTFRSLATTMLSPPNLSVTCDRCKHPG